MLKYLVVAMTVDEPRIEVVDAFATRQEAEDMIKEGDEGQYHLAVVDEGWEAVEGATL